MASNSNSPGEVSTSGPSVESRASTIVSSGDHPPKVPISSPAAVQSPASTSDISGNPTNSPESNDPWSGYYWLREANKPIPEPSTTLCDYIEAPNQEDMLLIQKDPPSSDSQPSTYILSPCTTPPPVDSLRRCLWMLDISKFSNFSRFSK